jgi:hypothetical protein
VTSLASCVTIDSCHDSIVTQFEAGLLKLMRS